MSEPGIREAIRRPKMDGTVRAPRMARKSSTWDRSRKWVEARANGRCEARTLACEHRGAQAHHILMRSQGGSDGTDNLLWVCPPCHDYVHANPAESYERGWLRATDEVDG